MSRTSKKVKDSQPRRYKITLVKTVTFRLTSVMEVQINDGDISSTTFVDGNHEISVDRSSIQEIEPHIEITADTEPSR